MAGALYFKCTVMSHQQIISALEAEINFAKVSSAASENPIEFNIVPLTKQPSYKAW